MSRIKFAVGETINFVSDNSLVEGVIVNIHEELDNPIAVVRTKDDRYEKIDINNVMKVSEQADKESVEKTEITITPEEFKQISTQSIEKFLSEKDPHGILNSIVLIELMVDIHKTLFVGDPVKND